MRISELGRRTGLSVATIKFYLREGLLPPGKITQTRQAEYGEHHIARINLIRTLTVIGRMSIASARDVLSAVDDRQLPLNGLCNVINDALFEDPPASDGAAEPTADAQVNRLVTELGWHVDTDSPARRTLAQVATALSRITHRQAVLDDLVPYARAAAAVAAAEAAGLPESVRSTDDATTVVAHYVLMEVAFAALRHMVREDTHQRRRQRGQKPDYAE